jgi:hypothetical protein
VGRFVLVLLFFLALPASAGAWTWPVDGPVVRNFSFDPDHPYASGQHRGIDIAASEATPVHAPAAGTVTFAGTVPSGGKTISIATPLGYTATLLHLGSITVERNARVGEGALVGTAGADSFVYFGLRATPNPQGYVDPLRFLPAHPGPTNTVDGGATAPVQAAEPAQAVAPAPAASAPEAGGTAHSAASPPADQAGETATEISTPATGWGSAAGGKPVASPAGEATTSATSSSAPQQTAEQSASSSSATTIDAGSPAAAAERSGGVSSPADTHVVADVPPRTSVAAGSRSVAAGASRKAAGADPADSFGGPIAPQKGPGAVHSSRADRPASTPRFDPQASGGGVERPGAETRYRAIDDRGASMQDFWPLIVATAVALLSLTAALLLRRRLARPRIPARIMSGLGRSFEQEPILVGAATEQEGPRRARVAVRERSAPSWARGGVRRAGGHLRAVPPIEDPRRADGERDRRARHARDGCCRPGERLAA